MQLLRRKYEVTNFAGCTPIVTERRGVETRAFGRGRGLAARLLAVEVDATQFRCLNKMSLLGYSIV